MTFFPGIIQTTASQISFSKMKIDISIKKINGNAIIMWRATIKVCPGSKALLCRNRKLCNQAKGDLKSDK